MDPEDVRALLAPYHAHVRSELERFGGTVEEFIGDAVMAVFGAPVAHEDDPERAIGRVERRTRWVDAAEATARGDYVGAARIYAAAGNSAAEAYTRLRAAQAGLPGAGLEEAIAFFRKAGATAYLREAEALLAPAAPRLTR